MSKKKHRPSSTVESLTAEAASSEPVAPVSPEVPATLPLHAEIAAFLARREELSRKVAEEIVATEKKLAELKQTAALLLAEATATPAKDRKPKKLKVKSAHPAAAREEQPAAEPPAEAVA